MNFIKRVFDGEADEKVHRQFVRFGKGRYDNRALINLQKGKEIKVSSSFEYANDFAEFLCELVSELEVSGIVMFKEKTENSFLKNEKMKNHLFNYEISGNIPSNELLKILEKAYFVLIDAKGDGFEYKCKKKLPKLGKSGERKTDDKFCVLKAELKYWNEIHKEFFSNLPSEVKKAKIKHSFLIEEIIQPDGDAKNSQTNFGATKSGAVPTYSTGKDFVGKDFAKIRELAKRKGKIIQYVDMNKQETKRETEFEV